MSRSEDLDLSTLDALLHLDHPRKLAARDWADAHMPARNDGSDEGVVDRAVWAAAAGYGIQGLLVPEEHGGSGSSAVDAMLTFEGLGLADADNGLVFALSSQVFVVQRALVETGSAAQLDRWLAPLVSGEWFGSFAMSEPDVGSDPWSITTRAIEQSDGSFVLNGTKRWVTLGPRCDMAIVFATTDPSMGAWGITAFLVGAETDGFTRGPEITKMGIHSCPLGDLVLEDCRVDRAAVLGKVGSGAAVFSRVVEAERAFLYASQVGAMERVLDTTVHRARTRQQSGQHIGSYQAVSHRIADMKLRHEAARLLLYKAAALYDRNTSITLAAALAKLQAAELGAQMPLDAMRVFGAVGYTSAGGVEAELRDGLAGLAYSGTGDVTRNIVASLLRLDRPVSD